MSVEWGGAAPLDDEDDTNAASGWPRRIGGYVKLIVTAVTTLGTTGILQWLASAGVTQLPAWATAGITAAVGLLTLLFSPKNKA